MRGKSRILWLSTRKRCGLRPLLLYKFGVREKRQENMRLLKIRPLLLLLPLVIIATVIAVMSLQPRLIDNPTPTPTSIPPTMTIAPSHRDVWNSRGSSDYEMIVEDARMPQPSVGQALTIQDGEVTK